LQGWAERADTPWATVEVTWYGGAREQLGGFSRTALWSTPGLSPVAIRDGLVADPEGQVRLDAFFWTDLQATSEQSLEWVVRRWSVEVTCEEARAHLGLATPRHWADRAIARTTPVLLALVSLVTLVARRLSQQGPIPVPATAWSHKAEPTLADGLTVVRRHLWRARDVVNSVPQADFVQFPREAFELLLTGLPLAA